jgi:DNA-binding NarL/FixJ family response regulator
MSAVVLHPRASERLRTAVTSTSGGRSIVLEGARGSGRSTLLAEAAESARAAGHPVLRARGHADARALDALRALLVRLPAGVRALPPRPRAAVDLVLSDREVSDADPHVLAIGVLGALEAASDDTPVLVVVDDLDLVDAASRAVLGLLPRRLARTAVVLLAAQQPTGLPPDPGTEVLRLDPLPVDAAERLLDAQPFAVHPATRRRLLAEAGGNALALVELARAAASVHPVDVLTLPRLPLPAEGLVAVPGDMSADERRALLLVALAHEHLSRAELVSAAADLEVGPEHLERLVRRSLVGVLPDGAYRPFHPLLVPAVLATAEAEDIAAAHAALAARTADRVQALVHRAAADPASVTGAMMEDAAFAAMRRGERRAAAVGFRRAATMPDAPADVAHRVLLAAETARQAGLGEEATALLDAADAAPLHPADVARSLIVHVRLRRMVGPPTHSNLDLVARAAALPSDDAGLRLLRARALGVVATCIWLAGSPMQDCEAVLDALPVDERIWEEEVAAAIVRPGAAPPGFRGELARRLLSFVRTAPIFDAVLLTYARAAEAIGALDLAEQAWTVQVEDHRITEAPADAIVEQLARGRARLAAGDPVGASHDAAEALGLAEAAALPRLVVAARALVAAADALRGRPAADGPSDALGIAARSAVLPSADALTEWARGLEALRVGDHERATQHLQAAASHPATAPWVVADLAGCARLLDRVETVEGPVAAAVAAAEATGSPWARSVALRARAIARPDDPLRDLEAALAAAVEAGSPLLVAAAHLDLGSALQRAGDLIASREHLRTAAATFTSIGAEALTERAQRSARAAGAAGAALAPDRAPALEGRELQVALLAASGLSNKAIAERLHISPGTVAAHLYRLFPRLGIARRSQLASALDGLAAPSSAES